MIPAVVASVIGVSTTTLAVTPEELASLHRAGLGDVVLAALIETTGVQGRIDGPLAVELRQAGVSDPVIAQAIRQAALDSATREEPPAAEDPGLLPSPASNVAIIGGHDDEPPPVVGVSDVVFVPLVVGVARHGCRSCGAPALPVDRAFGRFLNTDLRPLNTDLRLLNDGDGAPARDDVPRRATRRP
jgi:hypothetical protein